MGQDRSEMRMHRRGDETNDRGASMVEYALLVVLIAIVAIVGVQIAGENVSTVFSTAAVGLQNPN